MDADLVQSAVRFLDAGEGVILPSDTLYSLSVDATSYFAVSKLFSIKRRAASKAVPVFFESIGQIKEFCDVTEVASRLAHLFWPGKLSIILNHRHGLAENISPTDKVAVRMPDSLIIRDIIKALGKPITATSANISGDTNHYDYEELKALFHDQVQLIINGVIKHNALPSTVVDCSQNEVKFLRIGAIPECDIMAAVN